jgi:paraquat-inducible protein B
VAELEYGPDASLPHSVFQTIQNHRHSLEKGNLIEAQLVAKLKYGPDTSLPLFVFQTIPKITVIPLKKGISCSALQS